MKKLYIFKTGSTFPEIKEKFGDFDDFIINQIDISTNKIAIIDEFTGKEYPYLQESAGIIITGSHDMVTDNLQWMNKISDWIRQICNFEIPILGICFGHQLLINTFKGSIGYHPEGIEIGTTTIQLTSEADQDELFKIMPGRFPGHVIHRQTVLKPPEDCISLAYNNFEQYQSTCLKKNQIWSVQFHPEFNAEIMHMYIDKLQNELTSEGLDTNSLHSSIIENDFGKLILNRFIEICNI